MMHSVTVIGNLGFDDITDCYLIKSNGFYFRWHKGYMQTEPKSKYVKVTGTVIATYNQGIISLQLDSIEELVEE